MATYFVSPSGSDSNPGTLAQPFKTFAHAFTVLAANDTLNVRAGNYSEILDLGGPGLIPDGTGVGWPSTGVTTIQAYPADLATNPHPKLLGRIKFSYQRYVVWDGIDVQWNTLQTGSDAGVIFLNGCDYLWVRNCDVSGGFMQGIQLGGQPGYNGVDLRFTHVVSHDNGYGPALPSATPPQPGGGHGIYVSVWEGGGPILVDHCEFYGNGNAGSLGVGNSYGVQVYAAAHLFPNVTISNCLIHDNQNGMNVGSGDHHRVFNNSIYNNTKSGGYQLGIDLGYNTSTDIWIFNNLIYGNGSGISGQYGTVTASYIYNNTIYNNNGWGISLSSSGMSGINIDNNIVYNNTAGTISNTTGNSNPVGSHNFTSNPSFTGDLHLSAGSGAIHYAANLTSLGNADLDKDKDLVNRPTGTAAWDSGAYQYGGTVTPPPTTYYVAPASLGGNNSNSGTSVSSPKLTVNAGLALLAAGDTLMVRAGTYNEEIYLPTFPSGTGFPNGATTITKYTGDANPVLQKDVYIAGINNWIWDGIDINAVNAASGRSCLDISGVTNCLVTNAEFQNPPDHCISLHNNSGPIINIQLTKLKLHDSGKGTFTGYPRHNIYISPDIVDSSANVLIDQIECYNANSEPNSWGTAVYSTTGTVNGVTIRNSYYHNNSEGIQIGAGPNHKVYNNIVYNSVSASSYGEAAITVGYGTGMNNIQVYNNTIVSNVNGAYAVSVGTYGSPTNTLVKNNIFWLNSNNSIQLAGGSGTVSSNNTTVDPLFINLAGQNFHLQSGSPARGAGVNLSSVFTTDKDGRTRPSAPTPWDTGAYIFVSGSGGTIYYVAPASLGGSNSNNGTSPTTAFLTLSYALTRLAANDTLNVRAGNYTEILDVGGPLFPDGTGVGWPTTGAVTIQAYPADLGSHPRPKLIGRVKFSSQRYLIWDGIDIQWTGGSTNSDAGIMFFNGVDYGWVRNCDISGAYQQGIQQGGQPGYLGIDCRFTNLVVHDNGYSDPVAYPPGGGHGIYVSYWEGGGPCLVDHCEFYNNGNAASLGVGNSYGVQVYAASHLFNNVTISNCLIHDNQNGMVVGSGSHHRVFNNAIYNNTRTGGYQLGIDFGYNTCSDIWIFNNLIYGNGYGIVGQYGTVTASKIYNNTIYNNNSGYGISITSSGFSGVSIDNNIIYLNASGTIQDTSGNSNPVGAGQYTLNPNFTADLHLNAGSGAIGHATNYTSLGNTDLNKDKDLVARPTAAAWDSGAYQYAAAPDFSLSASPSTRTTAQGTSTTYTVTVNPVSGFSGNVTLSASGAPAGVTTSFTPNPATSTSTLNVTVGGATTPGTYTLTITGVSGALTHSTTVSLTVTIAPDYSITATPATQSLAQGASGTYSVTVNPVGGFSGNVTFSVSGAPAGVTTSFSPNPTTTSSSLHVTVGGATVLGTYTLTITGTSGALTHTTTVTLTVVAPPDFTLSATPATRTTYPGTSTTYSVSITPSGGFGGSVTLSLSGNPAGVTSSFNTNPTTSSSTLNVNVASSTANGSYTLTITGVSGSLTHTTTVTLVVTTAPDFSITATPLFQSINQGASGSYSVSIAPVGGFSSNVTLSASGAPAGVTTSFTPNPATTASTLNVTVGGGATPGSYTLTITGVSGALTHTTTVTLTVTVPPTPDFSLAATPSAQSVVEGNSTSFGITITPLNGFASGVTFSLSGAPTGVTPSFTPNPATAASTLNLTVGGATAPGSYTLTVTGTSGALTHTVSITLTVLLAGDFSLAVTPSSQSVNQGTSGSYSITITSIGGFTSGVTLSLSGAPTGVTSSLTPNPATSVSSLNITVGMLAVPGTYPLTLTGTSGALTHTAALTLTVTVPQDFTIAVTPASQSAAQGSSTSFAITITPTGGFSGLVTLSLRGAPTGTTSSMTPNPAATASTLNITTDITTPTGTYALTIAAVSGSLSHTALVTLMVPLAPPPPPPPPPPPSPPPPPTPVQRINTGPAGGVQKIQGWVEQGGTQLTITGAPGTIARKVQGSYPGAAVTVYISSPTPVSISAISRASNVVTVTVDPNSGFIAGQNVTIAGVADASFNGVFPILSTSSGTITYAEVGANASSTGGTANSTLRLATIYADASNTPKPNPFTSATDGSWYFYAQNGYAPSGLYDVRFSGAGIPVPFTIGALGVVIPTIGEVLGSGDLQYNARIYGTAVTVATGATPSVATSNVLRTANSSPTTITNLVDGIGNQQVTIIFGDVHTTILAGGNFAMAGNLTVPPILSTITFMRDQTTGTWVELCRSVN